MRLSLSSWNSASSSSSPELASVERRPLRLPASKAHKTQQAATQSRSEASWNAPPLRDLRLRGPSSSSVRRPSRLASASTGSSARQKPMGKQLGQCRSSKRTLLGLLARRSLLAAALTSAICARSEALVRTPVTQTAGSSQYSVVPSPSRSARPPLAYFCENSHDISQSRNLAAKQRPTQGSRSTFFIEEFQWFLIALSGLHDTKFMGEPAGNTRIRAHRPGRCLAISAQRLPSRRCSLRISSSSSLVLQMAE